jgi:cytochrome c-type biogenesis protein CcmE
VDKRLRVGILLGLLAAGGALAFAGAQPQGYLTVAQAIEGEHAHAVHVKATVVEGSLVRDAEPVRFLIADGAQTLEVRWDPAHPLPDHEAGGTIEGKSVVVEGELVREGDAFFLLAHGMQVGCASKYRPSE